MRPTLLRLATAALLALLLAGCALWRPTPAPLRMLRLPAQCATPVTTLMVFLPGSYSLPEDFITYGFVDGVRRQRIAADLWLVDAHRGYYSERSILDRLRQDVFAPAREAGYREIWLVGISIGAYGALMHAATSENPELRGIVAIAPYLGERTTSNVIARAGGLRRWQVDSPLTPGDDDGMLWRFLQRANDAPGLGQALQLYLGYGLGDRFAFSDRLLADALPAGRTFTAPGGHDWPAWQAVWGQLLPALPLARDASCRDGTAPPVVP